MASADAPTDAGNNLRALLVEEDGWLRQALELALALRGYDVALAGDLENALALCHGGCFTLAIVGLFPSGAQDRLSIVRELRAVPRAAWDCGGCGPAAVILACVAEETPQAVVAAVDAGASSYLSVPIDVGQLRARLGHAERLAALMQAGAAGGPQASGPWRTLVERAPDPLLVVSPEGIITRANLAAEPLLTIGDAPLTGTSIYARCHPDDAPRALELLEDALQWPGTPVSGELRFIGRDGAGVTRTFAVRAVGLLDEPGIEGVLVLLHDVSARAEIQALLERQALHDPVTRLPNRTLFLDYLEHALARADRRLESLVVLLIDIDHFARVNDTLGSAVGDQLLERVGDRLRASLRTSDTAARWGGDEFAVLLEDMPSDADAIAVAERITRELRVPFFVDGHEISITASIGLTFSHPGASQAGDLLRDADIALHRAKLQGRDRWMMFEADSQRRNIQAIERRPHPPVTAPPPPTPGDDDSPATRAARSHDEALQALMARIAALEREAARLESERNRERE